MMNQCDLRNTADEAHAREVLYKFLKEDQRYLRAANMGASQVATHILNVYILNVDYHSRKLREMLINPVLDGNTLACKKAPGALVRDSVMIRLGYTVSGTDNLTYRFCPAENGKLLTKKEVRERLANSFIAQPGEKQEVSEDDNAPIVSFTVNGANVTVNTETRQITIDY